MQKQFRHIKTILCCMQMFYVLSIRHSNRNVQHTQTQNIKRKYTFKIIVAEMYDHVWTNKSPCVLHVNILKKRFFFENKSDMWTNTEHTHTKTSKKNSKQPTCKIMFKQCKVINEPTKHHVSRRASKKYKSVDKTIEHFNRNWLQTQTSQTRQTNYMRNITWRKRSITAVPTKQ